MLRLDDVLRASVSVVVGGGDRVVGPDAAAAAAPMAVEGVHWEAAFFTADARGPTDAVAGCKVRGGDFAGYATVQGVDEGDVADDDGNEGFAHCP